MVSVLHMVFHVVGIFNQKAFVIANMPKLTGLIVGSFMPVVVTEEEFPKKEAGNTIAIIMLAYVVLWGCLIYIGMEWARPVVADILIWSSAISMLLHLRFLNELRKYYMQ